MVHNSCWGALARLMRCSLAATRWRACEEIFSGTSLPELLYHKASSHCLALLCQDPPLLGAHHTVPAHIRLQLALL